MVKLLIFLVSLSVFYACTDAASNPRGKKDQDAGNRTTQTAPVTTESYRAQFYRDSGAKIISYSELIKKVKNNKLEGYKLIPSSKTDNITTARYHNYDNLNTCGNLPESESIRSRELNCTTINADQAKWDGIANGMSGEGNWSLVYHQSPSANIDRVSIWIDHTTGLLWSDSMGEYTWDEASGVGVNDAEDVCKNFTALPLDEVKWILPSRNEFLQADLNGARFVLADTQNYFWTSLRDAQSKKAWGILQSTGELKSFADSTKLSVRCIGIPIK